MIQFGAVLATADPGALTKDEFRGPT